MSAPEAPVLQPPSRGVAKNEPVSEMGAHAGYWLRYVSNHVSHAFARRVEARGVTVAEWAVLRELFSAGAVNPSHVASEMGMTRGAVSKLVERLCRKQLVERCASEGDRRFQTVKLTPAGKRLVPALAKLADENDREFFGHLSAKETTGLIVLLQEIVRRHGWKDMPID